MSEGADLVPEGRLRPPGTVLHRSDGGESRRSEESEIIAAAQGLVSG